VSTYAPIALFVYNRPEHTALTVQALQRNVYAQESDLFIFSDAAKHAEHAQQVAEVRSYLRTINGFQSVTIVEREKNFGLAGSIINGVTSLIERFGHVIVVEDDLITSPYFLQYMNEALAKYEHEEKVISIHGYSYPTRLPLPETFFLRGADCWGWATWKRGWKLFEPDSRTLLAELKRRNLTYQFDFDGAYHYTRMLKEQIAGRVDSWAVRWHASAFLAEKLTLFPGRSQVNNIGGDERATHTKSLAEFQRAVAQTPIVLNDIPIEESTFARQQYVEFFRAYKGSLIQRVVNKIKSLVA